MSLFIGPPRDTVASRAAETGADRLSLTKTKSDKAAGKARKRPASPAPARRSNKKVRLAESSPEAVTSPTVSVDDYQGVMGELGVLLTKVAQFQSGTLGQPYLHPSLTTSDSFKLGQPAHTIIPDKDTVGSRKIRVKRLPFWPVEPELASFGPYFQANGVDYSPNDISTLARSIPDVSPF